MSHFPESVFNKPKILVTSHNSVQETSDSANVGTIVSGSAISYEPEAGSSKVVYEISYYSEKLAGRTFQAVYLEEYTSGSWSEINTRYRKNYGYSGSGDGRWHLYFRFVLPVWSGSRDLRLNSAASSSSRKTYNHAISHWDGSSDTTNFLKFCNTNLLVYSI